MAVGKEKWLLLGTRFSLHQHVTSTRTLFLSIYPMTGFSMRSHLTCHAYKVTLTTGTNIAFFSRLPSHYAVEFLYLFSFSKILQCICSLACCLSHPLKLLWYRGHISKFSGHVRPGAVGCCAENVPAPQEALLGSAALNCKHHQSRVPIFLVLQDV